ncbi:hypothetical protein BS78_03G200600 [Paspalum vaginatum]|nr:hypothetical protein BS78_03G200600 [Paspalum vaginatum]
MRASPRRLLPRYAGTPRVHGRAFGAAVSRRKPSGFKGEEKREREKSVRTAVPGSSAMPSPSVAPRRPPAPSDRRRAPGDGGQAAPPPGCAAPAGAASRLRLRGE